MNWFHLLAANFLMTSVIWLIGEALPGMGMKQFVGHKGRTLPTTQSSLEEDVRLWLEGHVGATAREVTNFANSRLAMRGYDYNFDVGDYIDKKGLKPIRQAKGVAVWPTYRFSLQSSLNGIVAFDKEVTEGPCGERFISLPVFSVRPTELIVALQGKKRAIKRPQKFELDQMELVDSTMKKIVRKWEVPSQGWPLGLSPDGQTLYFPVIFTDSDEAAVRWVIWKEGDKRYPLSMLAISRNGIRFEPASEFLSKQEAEAVNNHPKDANNAYLSFKRFRVAGKTFIVRFSSPCT